MQEYMIRKNEGKSVENEQVVADKAIKSFRKRSEEKKDRQGKEKETAKQPRNSRFLYAASTFLVLTIMVIAVTMISNYDKMKNMERAISNMARNTEASVAANASVKEEVSDRVEAETAQTEQGEAKETESTGGAEAAALTDGAQSAAPLAADEAQNTASLAVAADEAQDAASLSAENDGTQSGTSLAAAGETQSAGALTASGVKEQAAGAGENAAGGTKEAASASVRPQQAFYTVKDGDTLMDICRMYYGTDEKLDELCTLNNITDPNSIVPGQKIKLP